MNSGIQDVHNLIWKLAYVIKDWADPQLLDTYEIGAMAGRRGEPRVELAERKEIRRTTHFFGRGGCRAGGDACSPSRRTT